MTVPVRAPARDRGMEARIGRLLGVATLIAVGLLALGSALLIGAGQSPLDHPPVLDPRRLPDELASVQPAAVLRLGLLVVVITPAARVVAALVGYLRGGEPRMAAVALLILVVIAAGVAAGTAGG